MDNKSPHPNYERFRELIGELPFHSIEAGAPRDWWCLPAKGGYQGGCDTGAAAATAYIKFLRDTPDVDSTFLRDIAEGMLGRPKSTSRQGQSVGFWSVINMALRRYAAVDRSYDYSNYSSLASAMKKGLAFDEKSAIEQDKHQRRSEAAKRGHQSKRSSKVRPARLKRGRRQGVSHG